MLQSMRCLMEESEAGREGRAIMSLLMRHDAVPASELQRLCSRDLEARIAGMRGAGIHIESQTEWRVDGTPETVYGVRDARVCQGDAAGRRHSCRPKMGDVNLGRQLT